MNPRHILFIAEGQIGDLLLLTPALRAMKMQFAQASISVLIVERRLGSREARPAESSVVQLLGGPTDSILSTNPNIDQIFLIDRERIKSRRGLARMRAELDVMRFLRRQRFDCVVSTFPEDRFALWAFGSGAQIRVGQRDQALSWLLTHKPSVKKRDNGVLEYYCGLVRAIGANVRSTRTEYDIPAASRKWANDFVRHHDLVNGRRVVAVHPGASGNYKIWPPDRYAALIDLLQSQANARVVLCRSLHDDGIVDGILERLQTTIVEADTGGGNLAALLSSCALCISNDSGPRHLAIAVGTPSLAFFRQFHDREWQVYPELPLCATLKGNDRCPACPSGSCFDRIPQNEQFGSFCLRMVTVEQAALQAKKMLDFPTNK